MKLVMAADRLTDDILGVIPAGLTPIEEYDVDGTKVQRTFAIGDRAFRVTPLGVTASEVEVRDVLKSGGLCDLLVFDAMYGAMIPLPSRTLADAPPEGAYVIRLPARTIN